MLKCLENMKTKQERVHNEIVHFPPCIQKTWKYIDGKSSWRWRSQVFTKLEQMVMFWQRNKDLVKFEIVICTRDYLL